MVTKKDVEKARTHYYDAEEAAKVADDVAEEAAAAMAKYIKLKEEFENGIKEEVEKAKAAYDVTKAYAITAIAAADAAWLKFQKLELEFEKGEKGKITT